jgi:hypothetical protein
VRKETEPKFSPSSYYAETATAILYRSLVLQKEISFRQVSERIFSFVILKETAPTSGEEGRVKKMQCAPKPQ